jgi:twitching motility two-component system response regulator PilG
MEKKRILVVEDEESLLKLETILLTIKGYEVVGVLTGGDALNKLITEPIDLILLDIMLPDIDGFEVCKRVQNNPQTARIPIVILTAKKSPADLERGKVCGARAYLTKPFKSAMIIEVIEKVLRDSVEVKA